MKPINSYLLALLCALPFSGIFAQSSKIIDDASRKWNPIGLPTAAGSSATTYYFSTYQSTYAPLQGSTSLNGGEVWDDPEFGFSIGFPFTIFGQAADSLHFTFGLGGMVSTSLQEVSATKIILPFDADLTDRGYIQDNSQSNISYIVEGITGSRILKLEWNNAGFFEDGSQNNTYTDYIHFQLWLFEGSNNIEFHYGPSSIANEALVYDGESGPLCGISDYDLNENYFVVGPVANPTVTTVTGSVTYLGGTPTNGTVYKFATSNVGVEELAGTNFNVYPNPVDDVLTLSVNGEANHILVITDVTGRVVLSQNITATQTTLETGAFAPGVYTVTLTDAKGNTSARKLIKK